MRPQRREAIARQAESILERTGQTHGRVDVFEVASRLGAVVRSQDMEDAISGVLIVQQDQKFILVNHAQAEVRQRFSVAHELGHLVLHDTSADRMFVDGGVRLYQRVGHPSSEAYRSSESHTTPDEEREANHFAAAILMPEPAVRAYAFGKKVGLEEDLIQEMAEYFEVSVQAMSIRLQRLNILEPSDVF
jgi:Zn-dependent peptidase ImmA (M78 family)